MTSEEQGRHGVLLLFKISLYSPDLFHFSLLYLYNVFNKNILLILMEKKDLESKIKNAITRIDKNIKSMNDNLIDINSMLSYAIKTRPKYYFMDRDGYRY